MRGLWPPLLSWCCWLPRVYGPHENIRALQRLGLPLSEIGPILKISAAGYTQKQLMQFLRERLKVIRGKIAALREIEDYISAKLQRMQEEDKLSQGRKLVKKKTNADRSSPKRKS